MYPGVWLLVNVPDTWKWVGVFSPHDSQNTVCNILCKAVVMLTRSLTVYDMSPLLTKSVSGA